jgi:hypothetical protein
MFLWRVKGLHLSTLLRTILKHIQHTPTIFFCKNSVRLDIKADEQILEQVTSFI